MSSYAKNAIKYGLSIFLTLFFLYFAFKGTDFHALANAKVSVTPLQIDLTQYANLDGVRQWLLDAAAEPIVAAR